MAEFQTPSDTTYRIWDWGREGREMHLDQALACMSPGRAAPPCTTPADADDLEINIVANTPAFVLRTLRSSDQRVLKSPPSDRPEIWMVLEGEMQCESMRWKKGDTVFFPANRDVAIEVGAGSHWVHCHLPFGQERFA